LKTAPVILEHDPLLDFSQVSNHAFKLNFVEFFVGQDLARDAGLLLLL
jgi:hypothetical protein